MSSPTSTAAHRLPFRCQSICSCCLTRLTSQTPATSPCVFFVQATVYGQACDKTLSVAIEGSVDAAKALRKAHEDS